METKGRVVFRKIGTDYVQVTEGEWLGLAGGFHWCYLWAPLVVSLVFGVLMFLVVGLCKLLY